MAHYRRCPRYDDCIKEDRPDTYISVDIETDGPAPAGFSMLSIGLCVAGTFDGRSYRRGDDEQVVDPLYLELIPTGTKIDQQALAVNGLDREKLLREGTPPTQAMDEVRRWVSSAAPDSTPVMVAYPLAFDWSFVSWYFEEFSDAPSPFGHSSAIDIRSMYMAKARSLFSASGKAQIPASLRPKRRHTHNALDDALEQAELFSNIFEWSPETSPAQPLAHGAGW